VQLGGYIYIYIYIYIHTYIAAGKTAEGTTGAPEHTYIAAEKTAEGTTGAPERGRRPAAEVTGIDMTERG